MIETIKKMKTTIKENKGFDVIIIVASEENKPYWEKRLRFSKNKILSPKTKIIVTKEDWPKRAGHLLGTLYAFKKANETINLKTLLKKGGTIAIYHTAGQGKRMAPLCGTEVNNKPAIKLPELIQIEKRRVPITILEKIIFSTQIFAQTREKRVCVFWGDQIFIPSQSPKRTTTLPVELFGIKERIHLSLLNRNFWKRNYKDYGILLFSKKRGVLLREKMSFQEFKELLSKGELKTNSKKEIRIMKSVGCFSLDFSLFEILLSEFSRELRVKRRCLNTDFDLWVPLTSQRMEYQKQGGNPVYWERLKKIKKRFIQKKAQKRIIGEKDLGEKTIWWDYGNLRLYFKNLLKLTERGEEGKVARVFFNAEKYWIKKKIEKGLKIENCILIDSKIKGGEIENAVLVKSNITWAKIRNGIIFSTQAGGVFEKNRKTVKDILLYNVKEEKNMILQPTEVVTDITPFDGTKIRMRTNFSRDGKKYWKIRLPKNIFSFSEMENFLARVANDVLKFKI